MVNLVQELFFFLLRGNLEVTQEISENQACAAVGFIEEANTTCQLKQNTKDCSLCPLSARLTFQEARILK